MQDQITIKCPQRLHQLKLTSHGILYYLWSADLSKRPSQLNMSIFIVLNISFSRF